MMDMNEHVGHVRVAEQPPTHHRAGDGGVLQPEELVADQ